MNEYVFMQSILEICEKDSRYDPEAYVFIREALDFTGKMLKKESAESLQKHVSGQQLLEGIRQYAIEEFGPMAMTVFTGWGIRKTEDFGEIVFNLVEAGKLGKTNEDRREDFANGYDFATVFEKPFLPSGPVKRPAKRARHTRRKTNSQENASDER